WHKGNIFAPVIIGLCRALVYLATGAAVSGEIRSTLIIGATALAAHVIGLTYAAKQENLNQVGKLWPLFILAGPLLFVLSGIPGGYSRNVMQALTSSSGQNGSGRAGMIDGFIALADDWISRAANENALTWFRETIGHIKRAPRGDPLAMAIGLAPRRLGRADL